jgi:hypothetical protein
MGYQIVTNTHGESLSDEVWMDLIALASKHGFSAPRLSHIGQYAYTNLTEWKTRASTQHLSEHYLRGSLPKASQPSTTS